MTEQQHAIYVLRHSADLTPAEIANLTLADVHLSGGEPQVKVWAEDSGRRRTVAIGDATRNGLVAWLLQRPDSPVNLLFPGEDNKGLTPAAIDNLLADFEPPEPPVETPPEAPLSAETLEKEQLPTPGPSFRPGSPSSAGQPPFRAAPPPSRPEQIGQAEPEPQPALASPASLPAPAPQPSKRSFPLVYAMTGGLAVVACLGLLIAGVLVFRGEFSDAPDEIIVTPTPDTALAANPAATPTVEATLTATPTEVPPTETFTPAPTDTSAPLPTETPTPLPTASSVPPPPPPTDTPTPLPPPTDTPTPAPTATPTNLPLAHPAPSSTPTVGFKYAAPVLTSPEPDFVFIKGNTIELKWQSVGELAGNEQYAVRLIYRHNTEVVYRGANVKDTTWTIPIELYHDADGPEFDHTWYVYVEEVMSDGSGVSVSPESKHRNFSWD